MKTKYLLVAFIIVSIIANAQEIGFPVIRNYTPKEYNDAPQVMSVIQDRRGMMYFGTSIGSVLEYDGIYWRTIPIDKQATPYDLAMDKSEKIYVAATNEFGYLKLDKKGNTIYQTLTQCITDSAYKIGDVRFVKFTSKFVYFLTYEAILQYSPASKKLFIFKADTNGRFLGDFIHNDIYYVRLSKKGLMKIEGNELKPALQSEFFMDKNTFRVALPFNATKWLIPTRTEGLYIYQPDKDTTPKVFPIWNKEFLVDNDIYNASLFQKEKFVLGSIKGALLFDKQGKVLQKYNESNLLQNNNINEIYPDTSKNLWLGLENGISKTEYSQDLSYWDKNAGLKGSVNNVIRFNNTVYIATNTKLYFIDKNNQVQEVNNIPVGQNFCFLEFRNIKSLLCGTSYGIYEIKGDMAVQVYKGNHAFKLFQSLKNPFRVFSTDDADFISIRFDAGKWVSEGKWAGIKDEIRGIMEDENGDVWLGTSRNGVIRITPNGDMITKPMNIKYYTQKNGFASLSDVLPFRYKNKIIWGTEKGLYIYNPKTNKFEPFCELGEVFCNGSHSVYSLKEMPDGRIWICPKENKKAAIGYLQPTGQGNYDWVYAPFRRIPEMTLESFYIEPSGIVWIGGSEGLYRYDMSKDNKNYKQSFNCLIRNVTISADSLLYGGNTSDTTLSGFETLTGIDYRFNSVKFEFAAPFFDYEEKTLYSYQLVGFDKEWSSWSREPKKEYTNLSEGAYTFRVKARNVYGVESRISTYQFTILPPLYRTWWAYSLYIILLTFFIFLTVRLFIYRLIKQKENLEQVVKTRTAEIVKQKEQIQAHEEELEAFNEELTCTNEELHYQREEILEQAKQLKKQNEKLLEMDEFKQGMTSMIVHDLKNPLNLILNIPKSFEPERKDRVVQQSGKQMLNLVLNILDVNKYEGMSMAIHFEEKHLGLIAGSAIDQVQFLIGQRGITLINRVDTRIVVRADEEIIERMLVNLLTNAVKFTPSGGAVTISSHILPDSRVRIEVTDTGEGIAEDKMHLVFQKFGQIVAKKSGAVKSTGLGLAFCKMAVEAHGEEIGVSSEVGQGTTFWFTLQLAFAGDDEMQGMGKPEEREAERIVLTEEERRVLEPIIGQLKAFTVYETDDIEGILATLKQTESENIKRWILQVENTMVALNQTHYLEILKAI